jgi:AAHS family 4-hydroxybenzoate transporter-like MFS transporter
MPRVIDVASVIEGRRLGAFNYRLILLSWLITAFDGFDMMLIGFTGPYMRDQLGLSANVLGHVISVGVFGMLLGGFLFSYAGDRIGRRTTIVIAATAFGVLTTATAFARTYPALLAMRFLDGLAIGGLLPLAWALNVEFVPRRMRSTIVTIIMVGYSFGSASAGPITNWIAPHHGWQGVYLAGGLATLCCAVALSLGLPESIRFLAAKRKRPDLVARTLKRIDPALEVSPTDDFVLADETSSTRNFHVRQLFAGDLRLITPLLWIGYFASSLAIYFASSWGPSVLEALKFSRQTAALATSTGSLLGAAAGLALMRFTDRRGPRSVAIYPALAAPVLLVLGLGFVPMSALLAFSVLSSMLISGEHFGVHSIASVFYPSAIRASGGGWATSVAKFGAVLGPLIGGMVLSSGLPILRVYVLLSACPAVLLVCALGIAAVVRRTRGVANPAEALTTGGVLINRAR